MDTMEVNDDGLNKGEQEQFDKEVAQAIADGMPLSKEELRQKIKEIQAIKAEAAKKEAVEKEIKRRLDGQAMLEAQRKNAELKQKVEIDLQKKQRNDDALFKKQLLEKVAQEKEERRLKNNMVANTSAAPASTIPTVSQLPRVNSRECRICYQFSDGRRVLAMFDSTSKFQAVFDHVAANQLFDGLYELHRTYPREVITDFEATLVDLKLTPSSVVAVVKHTTTQSLVVTKTREYIKSMGYLLLTLVYSPLATIAQFFSTLFGFHIEKPEETVEYEQRMNHKRQLDARRKAQRDRRDHGDNDTDDEATWNGNSTQQL